VRIGRNCQIGPNCSITHALIGNHVTIHGGVRVGQDGFGFAIGRASHLKVPQLGRVILQDHVDLGANVCIDRGTVRDTVIGEGTKIDNLGQVGHNVVIGRHCLIAGHVGIAGSTEIEDFVIVGGKVGFNGHIRIGAGTQIAGGSNVSESVPAGSRIGGTPARPLKEWFRQIAILDRLVRDRKMGAALLSSGQSHDHNVGEVE
jgi:UDP-3-O-[3-hydroxymyristoyl] glucosamine N-acyltransferase